MTARSVTYSDNSARHRLLGPHMMFWGGFLMSQVLPCRLNTELSRSKLITPSGLLSRSIVVASLRRIEKGAGCHSGYPPSSRCGLRALEDRVTRKNTCGRTAVNSPTLGQRPAGINVAIAQTARRISQHCGNRRARVAIPATTLSAQDIAEACARPLASAARIHDSTRSKRP